MGQDLGREPTLEELSSETGIKEKDLERLMEYSRRALSLEQPVGEDGKESLGDMIEDKSAVPDEDAYRHLLRDKVRKLWGDQRKN